MTRTEWLLEIVWCPHSSRVPVQRDWSWRQRRKCRPHCSADGQTPSPALYRFYLKYWCLVSSNLKHVLCAGLTSAVCWLLFVSFLWDWMHRVFGIATRRSFATRLSCQIHFSRSLSQVAKGRHFQYYSTTPLPNQSLSTMDFKYPSPRRDDQIDDYYGTKVSFPRLLWLCTDKSSGQVEDPYRWMEDPDSRETQEWCEQENKITNEYLSRCPSSRAINKRLTEMYNYPKYSVPFKRGGRYFYYHNTGLQNQSVMYVQDSLESDAKVWFIDSWCTAFGAKHILRSSWTPMRGQQTEQLQSELPSFQNQAGSLHTGFPRVGAIGRPSMSRMWSQTKSSKTAWNGRSSRQLLGPTMTKDSITRDFLRRILMRTSEEQKEIRTRIKRLTIFVNMFVVVFTGSVPCVAVGLLPQDWW